MYVLLIHLHGVAKLAFSAALMNETIGIHEDAG